MAFQEKEKINYAALWEDYHKKLTPGQRAELRRVRDPEELRDIPALYRLLKGRRPGAQLLRIVYCLPYVRHAEHAKSLGAQLAKSHVSEQRLFQIIRSEKPNDLMYLRRILQQIEPSADWNRLGDTLFYWDDGNKRRIVEEYYLSLYDKKGDQS